MKKQDFQIVVNRLMSELEIPMKRKRENEDSNVEEHEITFFNLGNAGLHQYTSANPSGKEEDMEVDEDSKNK